MIARTWRGWIRTERTADYVEYLGRTGIPGYLATPGNSGAHVLTRDLGDGRTEVVTLSFWSSLDDVRGFAGEQVDTAVFYPEDDDYLLDRELTVTHYEVPEIR